MSDYGRDEVETHNGIETTTIRRNRDPRRCVATREKPTTGLKHNITVEPTIKGVGRDEVETHNGIETILGSH